MAEPIRPSDSKHYINSGNGFTFDLLENFLDICYRTFEDSSMREFLPVFKEIINPKQKNLTAAELPGLFVWSDGEIPEVRNVGALNNNQSLNIYEQHYINCQYVYGHMDSENGYRNILIVSDRLKEQILENHNVNSLINGGVDIVELSLAPDVFLLGKKLSPVHSVHFRMVCSRTRRQKTSRYR